MNNDSLKLVLFLALSGLILFGYQIFFMPKETKHTPISASNEAQNQPSQANIQNESSVKKQESLKQINK